MSSLNLWIFACVLGLFLAQKPQLIYVQEVFRHGARYAIYPNSKDGSEYARDERSTGQLTKQGKSMHYILGKKLYEQYWNALRLPNIYNQSKFYVKSTNVNRTIESAQSQLLGIMQNLPSLQIQAVDVPYAIPLWENVTSRETGSVYTKSPFFNPVPIHVEKGAISPTDNGDFLRTYSPDICYKQNQWVSENLADPVSKNIMSNPDFVAALKALSDQLKQNVTFGDVYKYYDNAVCMKYEQRKGILDIFSDGSPYKKALTAIYSIDLYMKYYFQRNPKQISATATGYFNETVHNFKKVIADPSGVQWSLYSAHDTTVGNFLAALNLTNVKCIYQNYLRGIVKNTDTCVVQYPGYTANIIFEVYRYSNDSHTFKIRYNGAQKQIPFCGWSYQCKIQVFYAWYDSWKDQNYAKSCGIGDTSAEFYLTLSVVEFGVILCFLIYILINYLQNRKSSNKIHLNVKEQPKLNESLLSINQ